MKRFPILTSIESRYYFDYLLSLLHQQASRQDQLKQLNITYLSIINTLTEQREKQIFTGFFAKINFICQAYNLSDAVENELQSLRRFLYKNLTQKNLAVEEEKFLKCLQLICELIYLFSEEEIPAQLSELFSGKDLPVLFFKEKPEDFQESLYAVVVQKSEILNTTDGKGSIELVCDTEKFGTVKIKVKDIHYFDPIRNEIFRKYELSKHCSTLVWPFQTICLTQLEKTGENAFQTSEKTFLITSPDYLIDATVIASCVSGGLMNPYLYLLNKLKFFKGNEFTFAGKIINEVLDNYLEQPDLSFAEIYKKTIEHNRLEAAILGINPQQLEEFYYKTQAQFETIRVAMQKYVHQPVITEPTFISAKYGIQGRLDVLVLYPDNENRKDILELKSTSFPLPQYEIARKDHLVQVACYNLLTDSAFENRRGISAILYSKDHQTPLRDCGRLNFEQQDAMWLRNCMVYIDWKISKAEVSFYDFFLKRLLQTQMPVYIQKEVEDFARKWSQASATDKHFFTEWMGVVTRELMVAKVGGMAGSEPAQGFAGLWKNTLSEKKDSFSLLDRLEITGDLEDTSEILFKRPEGQNQITVFRPGDIIVLYPQPNEELLEAWKFQLLKGNILEIHPRFVKVKIWHKVVDKNYFKKFSHWAVEPSLMESNFNNQFAGLSEFLSFDRLQKDLWYGNIQPQFDPNFFADYRPFLNEEQNRILNQALSAQNYFLLQGPPGTGKTSKMLRCMVDHLFNHTEENILLLAYTNRATDEICLKIEEVCDGNYLRLGNMDEESEFYHKSLRSENRLEEIRNKLSSTKIFVSTVSSLYNHLGLLPSIDTVIVDEASQLLEPSLCGILPRFKRFILIGDEKQLPAVVTQPAHFCKTEEPLLQQIGINDLSLSVFERLLENAKSKNWDESFAMLSHQYRTHRDIAGFISKEFYIHLQTAGKEYSAPMEVFDPNSEDKYEQLLASSRLIYIPTQKEENLKFHSGEAKIVSALLQTIRRVYQANHRFNAGTVGVITPYRAQVAEIYRLLDEELRESVTIDTVERYQGSEREIILISMAVNHPAQLKNLQSFNANRTVDKKLNVALSRAKEQLVMLGNSEILQTALFYDKFLKYVIQMNKKQGK